MMASSRDYLDLEELSGGVEAFNMDKLSGPRPRGRDLGALLRRALAQNFDDLAHCLEVSISGDPILQLNQSTEPLLDHFIGHELLHE